MAVRGNQWRDGIAPFGISRGAQMDVVVSNITGSKRWFDCRVQACIESSHTTFLSKYRWDGLNCDVNILGSEPLGNPSNVGRCVCWVDPSKYIIRANHQQNSAGAGGNHAWQPLHNIG